MSRYVLLLLMAISFCARAQRIANSSAKKALIESRPISTLVGTIGADSGTMVLFSRNDDSYLPSGIVGATAKISNGKFKFCYTIDYPCQVILGLKIKGSWKYLSHPFYLEPGTQSVVCNIDSLRELPNISNKAMNEYLSSYSEAYNIVRQRKNALSMKKDSLHTIYGTALPKDIKAGIDNESAAIYEQTDTVLYHYIKEHNTSYVALWELITSVQARYKPIYELAFMEFSDVIKNSLTGRVLAKKLTTADHLNIGDTFPPLQLLDTADVQQGIPKISPSTKYTLIDFWFTHCGACRSQFPELKKIYKAHRKNGFEIIGISTDQKQYVDSWKKMIVETGLNWLQYLDIGGVTSSTLAINSFPRNYLLDKDGKIIKVDISMDDLKTFLLSEGM